MWRKLLLGIILNFVLITPALAMSISPARFLVTGDAPSTQTIKIEVRNTEDKDIVFRPVVFGARQGDQGQPIYEKNIDVAEGWLRSDADKLSVASGAKGVVNFEIKIPRGVPPGSHYLGVGVQTAGADASDVGVSAQVLSVLTLQVSGTAYEVLQVEKFDNVSNRVSDKTWAFDFTLLNKGNVEVNATGEAVVLNWRGNKILTQPLFADAKILSGARKITEFRIGVGENKFWPGLYQVQTKVGYGMTKQNLSSSVYVWYLPVWSLVILVVLIVAAIGFVMSGLRRYKIKKIMARYDKK